VTPSIKMGRIRERLEARIAAREHVRKRNNDTENQIQPNAQVGVHEESIAVKNDVASLENQVPPLSPVPQHPPAPSTPPQNEESFARAVIKVALPFRYFDLYSTEGRREYVDFVVCGRVGHILSYLPFILMIAISQAHPSLALWLSFGACSLSAAFQFVHSTYTPNSPFLYWFTASSWATYLILAVVYELDPFNPTLIRNIAISSMVMTVLLSILVRNPFSMQYARAKVSNELANTTGFLMLNMYLSGFWLLLFAVMAACMWGSYPFSNGSAANIILGTVIPISVIIVAFVLSPYVAAFLESKGNSASTTIPSSY
jgi:hypothetical protein